MTREEEVIDLIKCSFWHTRLGEEDKEWTIKVLEQRLKTGYWVLTDVEKNKVWHCNCSECGKEPQDYVGGSEDWWLIKNNLPGFCPGCGARMRGVRMKNEVYNNN